MYYLQSRYYNTEIRRFICADSYMSTGQGINSCNMFEYCSNNPITCLDSSGHFFESAISFFKGFGNAIVQAVTGNSGLVTGGAALTWVDGPAPFADIVVGAGVIIYRIYQTVTQEKQREEVKIKANVIEKNKKDVVIYRHNGTNPGNLTPK